MWCSQNYLTLYITPTVSSGRTYQQHYLSMFHEEPDGRYRVKEYTLHASQHLGEHRITYIMSQMWMAVRLPWTYLVCTYNFDCGGAIHLSVLSTKGFWSAFGYINWIRRHQVVGNLCITYDKYELSEFTFLIQYSVLIIKSFTAWQIITKLQFSVFIFYFGYSIPDNIKRLYDLYLLLCRLSITV